MEFTRTQDLLLDHNHGLIHQITRNSGSLVRMLSAEMGKNKEIAEPVSSNILSR